MTVEERAQKLTLLPSGAKIYFDHQQKLLPVDAVFLRDGDNMPEGVPVVALHPPMLPATPPKQTPVCHLCGAPGWTDTNVGWWCRTCWQKGATR